MPVSMGEPLLAGDDPRRMRVLALGLALPEAEASGERHLVLKVRGRSFAWLLDNHHDDGRIALAAKVLSGENRALAEADPEHYFVPPYLGANGWVALRLDRGAVDWDVVDDLLHTSYRLVAPRRLARMV